MANKKPLVIAAGQVKELPAGDYVSASDISNTPAGNIVATTVQAAINEIDTEKALLAGSTAQNFSCSHLGISGGTASQYGLFNVAVLSGSATQIGNVNNVTASSEAAALYGYDNYNYIPAAEFTLTSWIDYNVRAGSLGIGAIVTSRYNFFAAANNEATNNYIFYGNNTATPENNHGTTSTITEIAVTSNVVTVTTVAAHGLTAGTSRVTVTPTINTQLQGSGILVASTPSSTTFTYARTTANVTSDPAETGSVVPQKRWNLYMGGTALNYLNGALMIGSNVDDGTNKLQVTGHTKVTGYLLGGQLLGYSVGVGGDVTQATSKATAVTLNKPCGTITMNGGALAAGTIVSFVLNNSVLFGSSILVCTHIATGTLGAYTITAGEIFGGTCTIYVRNNTAGSLSEAIKLRFAAIYAPES